MKKRSEQWRNKGAVHWNESQFVWADKNELNIDLYEDYYKKIMGSRNKIERGISNIFVFVKK